MGNFQLQAVVLSWIIAGQGLIVLIEGAGGVVWIFFLSPIISFVSLSLGRRPDT